MQKARKSIAFALSAALFFTLTSFTPSHAITPGEGCQKVGQMSIVNGTKHFCVLHKASDGRTSAIWNKAVAFPESPGKKLTVRYIAFAALKNYFEQQPIRTDKVDAHIDPALDPKIRELFLTYADDAMRFWGKDYLPDATMFIGAETPWYVKEKCDYYKSLNDPTVDFTSCFQGKPVDLAGGSGWPNQQPDQLSANGAVYGPYSSTKNQEISYRQSSLFIYLSSLETKKTLNISAVTQHELTHIAQWNAYGTGVTGGERAAQYVADFTNGGKLNYKLRMRPEVWTEGSANYFGNALAEMRVPGRLEKDMSAETGKRLLSISKDLDFLITEPYPYTGPNMTSEQNDIKNDFYSRRYWAGGLMTELMCAHFGFAKCMSFNRTWAEGWADPDATFQSVFEKHFPISWTAWTKATDAYVRDILNSKPTPLTKYFPADTESASPTHTGTTSDPQPLNTYLTKKYVKVKVLKVADQVSELVCKTELIQDGCDFGGDVDADSESRFVEITITITNNGNESWTPGIFGLYNDDEYYGGNFIVDGIIPGDIELAVGKSITLKTYIGLPNNIKLTDSLFYISENNADDAFYLKLK
jgi:hypothetical protein